MADTKFKKGKDKTGGREKGVKNKFTEDIKKMILNTLNDKRVEGEEGFIKWVIANKRNKEIFYGWLMKMLPSSVSMEHSGAVKFELSDKFLPKTDNEKK